MSVSERGILVPEQQSPEPEYLLPLDSPVYLLWRENPSSLGGPAALLEQLAHPLIAENVHKNSRVYTQPMERFRQTKELVGAMIMGTHVQREAAAAYINKKHRQATGTLTHAVGGYSLGFTGRRSLSRVLCVY